MIIEKATSLDLESICQIDSSVIGNDSRKEYLSESIEKETCIIARMDGNPVGFAVFNTSFYDNCFIWLVIVHPQFRRKGIASGLIQYVEKNCPTSKLFTSTNESNVTMQKVCEALGFARSGVIENLDDGDPEIVFYKSIG
ncbi:GNAT family N-acetyltransferase [Paenibacillus apiarius]|uniref:GNAT family N-acetyltransferase n=1 Tax=Paenibacillus apiarius TaxID=46240 RepID=UPI00197D8C3F|nr:GNAT family N-acetyltransferase [Paenibacillus apiarius]MBN3526563.1 GNAT family N-acetyltransferase [Paenibacillus apiarius]